MLAGSDMLFVTTNDAWFGEEGCAIQHAAHSVLRAVESGLPLVRCGNAGWSGWIDSRGRIRNVLENDLGSIYFKGASVFEVDLSREPPKLYSKLGDFFPLVCIAVMILFFSLWLAGFSFLNPSKLREK